MSMFVILYGKTLVCENPDAGVMLQQAAKLSPHGSDTDREKRARFIADALKLEQSA